MGKLYLFTIYSTDIRHIMHRQYHYNNVLTVYYSHAIVIIILVLVILVITLNFAYTSLPYSGPRSLAGHWLYPGLPSTLGFFVTDRSRH